VSEVCDMERVMESQGRLKVSLMIPHRLIGAVDDMARGQLGIGRGAFFTISGAFLLAKMSLILAPKKRLSLLKDVEAEFQRIVEEARKAA